VIERYLQDLERRVDPQVEQSLFEQWKVFASGRCEEPIFSPRRPSASPPAIEWPHVLVNDALLDFEAMALQQLEGCSKTLAEGSGALLSVRCNYGTAILPSLFGAELFLMDREIDTLPACRPLPGGSDAVKRLLDRGVPDLNAGQGGAVFRMGQYYKELFAGHPKLSKHVHIYHPDLQGPMNVCEMLWGGSLYVELYDKPDLVKGFLSLITETYVRFMRRWNEIVCGEGVPPLRPAGILPAKKEQGQDALATKDKGKMPSPHEYAVHWSMLHRGCIMVRNDAATNLSPAMYEEFVRSCDERLFKEFGGGGIHFCGRGDHFIAKAAAISGVHAVNITQPHLNDVETIFQNTIDKGIQLIGFDRQAAERALRQGRDLRGNVHCW